MIITNKIAQTIPSFKIGDIEIQNFDHFKYLGFVIDESVNFLKHLELLQLKLSALCGVSFRLRKHLNLNDARNFYYSIVGSTAMYCIAAWGGLLRCTSEVDQLKRLRRRIVVNLFGRFYNGINGLFNPFKLTF